MFSILIDELNSTILIYE